MTPYLIGRCLYGADETVCEFVSNLIGEKISGRAIGVVSNGAIVGGVTYSQYTGTDMRCCFAGSSPKWLSRDTLRQFFSYPFEQIGCARISVLVGVNNERSLKVVRGLGFIQEGVIRKAMDDGSDGILLGILKEECRWIGAH